MKEWYIHSFGRATETSIIWLNCHDIVARDNMVVGQTCLMTFQTGMGKSTIEVERTK